ncbi:MAG TPA: hypothetical protein VLS89_05055 [Candidatus Nanopelagicales bacterium]|nr:hypothetical protein [Candidatus Nanopelagicales bacterium]
MGPRQQPLISHLAAAPESLVSAAYANHLDLALHVLASDEPLPAESRGALAAALHLPSDRTLLLDQMARLGAELAQSFGAPPEIVNAPPWSVCAAALARHAWGLSDVATRALLAVNSPELMPIVRLTEDDPIPGLFLLCEAVQLWKRPVRIGGEELVELEEIEVEGLDEGGPDGRMVLGERLVFRLDYRFNDVVLEKTGFNPKLVRRRMREALGRLRIAAEAFPDVIVELRLPDGDERIEVLREAVPRGERAHSRAKANGAPARRSTWEELEPALSAPSSREALDRLDAVFPFLAPEQAQRARRRLRTLIGSGRRGEGVRARAAEMLVQRFFDEPSDKARVATLEALLKYTQRKGLGAAQRTSVLEGLAEIYGGLPWEAADRLLSFLLAEVKAGGLSADFAGRVNGIAARHKKRSGTRTSPRARSR